MSSNPVDLQSDEPWLGETDLWLLAHPDLVDMPAVRAVVGFIAASAREDRVLLRG